MLLVQDVWYSAKFKPLTMIGRYGLALALFGAALGARFALIGVLPPTGFPFLTFFPAVMITALVAGLWPGLMVALLSVLAAGVYFVVPPGATGMTSADVIAMVFFALVLVIDCVVIHLMTSAVARARAISEELARNEARFRMQADQLTQADLRKDEFLAMLAHELRNPLAPIAAAADLLRIGDIGEEKVRKTAQIIRRQVMHLTGLIDDLLDVSRVTRGLVSLKQQRLDTAQVVAEAVEQIRPLLDRRHQHFSFRNKAVDAFVLGDKKRLVQVVANLLNNAAKFSPDCGSIELLLELADGQVRLTLTDDGVGMAADFVDKSFELFTQGECASDRAQGGLGIGLALVRSLVELHGGWVSAASDGHGKGSRFTVALPHMKELEQTPTALDEPDAASRANGGLRVLIVDDNVDAADMLGMFVESLGHQVVIETSSLRALETAGRMLPQVCLLDIGMPEMNGNQLARQLRSRPKNATALLIAISGYGQEQDRASTLQAGFDHHFVKPVDAAKLKELLSAIDGAAALSGG